MRNLIIILLFLAVFGGCQARAPQKPLFRPAPHGGLYKDAITENRYKSVMRILTTCKNGDKSMGTGTAISDHEVITAYHVVDCPLESVSLLMWDGSEVPATLAAIGKDKKDAARLVTETKLKNWVAVRKDPPPFIDEDVCYTGGGGTKQYIVTKCGKVIQQDEDGDFWVYMHVVPGNSGGPVFDMAGQLIGIIDWRYVPWWLAESDREFVGGGVPAKFFP